MDGVRTPAEFRSDGTTIECHPMYTYLGHSRVLLLPWPVLIYQLLDIKCVSNLYSALVFLLSVGYLLLHQLAWRCIRPEPFMGDLIPLVIITTYNEPIQNLPSTRAVFQAMPEKNIKS